MWIKIPLLYSFLILLTSCSGSPSKRDSKVNPIDPTVVLHYEKSFTEYVEILLLLGSEKRADREEAAKRLELLSFAYFPDDPQLIRAFQTSTPAESEAARKELVRRGQMLDAIRVFTEPYSRVVWNQARKKIISLGEDSRAFLVDTLLRLLINGTYRKVWTQLRHQLVECGGMALETTAELARIKADKTPTTAIWKQDDLVQLFMVMLSFGSQGRPFLEKLSIHSNWNVRKALAKAIGTSLSGDYLDLLEKLLSHDKNWQVKAAAAESLGHFRYLRDRVGTFLLKRIREEKDNFVLHKVILAVGRVHYTKGIPRLVTLLEHPNQETVQASMEALYDLTGERLNTSIAWQKWYRDKYPAWVQKQKSP
ncbi:MAG: HEAT repeat domain-containing protein [Planctomycetota bacterium]|jgi:hypothetical protein|nr:HEAT repeat domain-containing protein [Planctomycetota bacterium]